MRRHNAVPFRVVVLSLSCCDAQCAGTGGLSQGPLSARLQGPDEPAGGHLHENKLLLNLQSPDTFRSWHFDVNHVNIMRLEDFDGGGNFLAIPQTTLNTVFIYGGAPVCEDAPITPLKVQRSCCYTA